MNIVEEIFLRADRPAIAIISGARQWTFGEIESLTNAAAARLGEAGRQRVGLYCPNGVAHIVWSLAILKCGGVIVPVAPELSPVERDTLLRTTALDTVLCADGKQWHRPALRSTALEVEGLSVATLTAGWREGGATFDEAALAALNPALIRFSSGTTGNRKGVVLSHETLLARVTSGNAGMRVGPGDRVIWMLPMAHHFAVSIILYLLHGATTVLEDSHLGDDVFRALSEHRGTMLYASPFHYALLSSCEEARPVPSLRLAVSTAAALPVETARKFRERLGIPLTQALGIIECGLPLFNARWPGEKPESVGCPQPDYAISIRDESGAEVAPGATGELFLKGPGFVDAYLSPWMPRGQILENGWFRTGDHARVDGEGAVFLVGRSHSVINVGGMKCFPEEIEATLNEHPAISESRVSSIAHPTFGMMPVAEIVPTDPAAPPKTSELIAHCRARLSSYKMPLKYTVVAAIPKTPSGKIQR
jgi:long-chain acyl-CoA synthetase